jgi:hypothetical protein
MKKKQKLNTIWFCKHLTVQCMNWDLHDTFLGKDGL